MYKGIAGAILYVAIVMGGYAVYNEYFTEEQQVAVEETHPGTTHPSQNGNSHEERTEEHGKESHENGAGHGEASQVNTYVRPEGNEIRIYLKDYLGNAVDELVVNHEKLLHFIVVDEQLKKYYHLHPEQIGKGEFRIGNVLPDGFYKGFIDIKPENLAYHVTPVLFVVGDPVDQSHGHRLIADQTLVQEIDGETVKLTMSTDQINETATLSFELNRTALTPYLGAMGHVVILDEEAQNFLHVHPVNHENPVFQTTFKKPGLYKIWAEFKQGEKVRAFPYVVEIKG